MSVRHTKLCEVVPTWVVLLLGTKVKNSEVKAKGFKCFLTEYNKEFKVNPLDEHMAFTARFL